MNENGFMSYKGVAFCRKCKEYNIKTATKEDLRKYLSESQKISAGLQII